VYQLEWQNVNLGESLIAAAPFGGPIGTFGGTFFTEDFFLLIIIF